jgi:hypothetical protein
MKEIPQHLIKELEFHFGERKEKPNDDNIFYLQHYLIQTLAPYGIFVVGFSPQKEGSLDFLLEKEGVQFRLKWWGGSHIEIKAI